MFNTSNRVWFLQSPDKLFDVVPIFLDALRKTGYFNRFYVATDRKVDLPDDCVYIPLEKDFGWSNNIIRALEFVEEETFFLGCEDHIVVRFDKERIEDCFRAVDNGELGCIRLTRKPRIQLVEDKPYSAIVKPDCFYISLQPTIWNKDYLKSAIALNESAWQFEEEGTKRIMKIKELKAGIVDETVLDYQNFFGEGGLFRPSYIKYAKENNIKLDSGKFYCLWKKSAL